MSTISRTTPQHPIGSGFGAETSAAEVIRGIDLSGKTAIVTGGYSGIGLETTRTLFSAGARVVVPARDLSKATSALATLPGVIADTLNLMNPSSIDAFANRFVGSAQALHILVNNAGIMANPLARDARGYESQFATNHLGHFQLTARLWPALRRAKGARVVSLSSVGHRRAQVDFEDPNFQRREYDRWAAYGQSKTANALFAISLDTLGAPDGIRAFSVHPGGVITVLVRHMSTEELRAYGVLDEHGRPIIDPARNKKTSEQGAATSVWCATSRQLDGLGGVYCEDCDVAVSVPGDSTELRGVRSWATNREFARELWNLSEKLTGIRFPVSNVLGGLTMNDQQNSDRLELSRLLQQAKPLVTPLYPDQYKQWAEESPLAQELSALLAKHPEYYDEIHAEIGGVFSRP